MAQNLKLDPVKKDYVLVNGSPVPSDSVLEKTYIALSIPQNKWMYGESDQGSLLYTLVNQKRTPNVEQLYANYANDAVTRQLIETGDATLVQTTNLQTTQTGTSNQINVVPASSQLSDQLDFVSV